MTKRECKQEKLISNIESKISWLEDDNKKAEFVTFGYGLIIIWTGKGYTPTLVNTNKNSKKISRTVKSTCKLWNVNKKFVLILLNWYNNTILLLWH